MSGNQPTLFEGELASSDVTGEWQAPLHAFICLPSPAGPAPCDCGFVGDWEWRGVFVWHESPGTGRSDTTVRRDIARGFPPRPSDEGWWVAGGRDERCPGCGDIERFDRDGKQVARFAERAKVFLFMDAWKAARQ